MDVTHHLRGETGTVCVKHIPANERADQTIVIVDSDPDPTTLKIALEHFTEGSGGIYGVGHQKIWKVKGVSPVALTIILLWMPERIFKYQDTKDLIDQVKELGVLMTNGSGSTTALKNSSTGFLKESGPVTQTQLRNYYMAGRYEIFLRGQGVDGKDPESVCAGLEAINPLRERRMRVQSNFQNWPGPSPGWWNI